MAASSPVPESAKQEYSVSSSGEHRHPDHESLIWDRDGQDWPNRDSSQFVTAGGIRWHVQVMGQGPALLLLHGTGAASHSWRDLAPLLAEKYTVVVPDLPGHGFTQAPRSTQLSMTGMAQLLAKLLNELDLTPNIIVGHSAGAAIGAQMCFDPSVAPAWLVSLNGALLPLSGLPGFVFLPMARFLANRPIWARLLANSATDPRAVRRLLGRTGSAIDPPGIELYARLLRNTGHTAAALGMMANWNLQPLQYRLPELTAKLLLLVGEDDQMVPPEQARLIQRRIPQAKLETWSNLGHLLHEEAPQRTADLLLALNCADPGTLPK